MGWEPTFAAEVQAVMEQLVVGAGLMLLALIGWIVKLLIQLTQDLSTLTSEVGHMRQLREHDEADRAARQEQLDRNLERLHERIDSIAGWESRK